MSKKTRRVQSPKARNEEYMRGMQEIRFSNAAGAHRPKTAYTRKPKHRNRQFQED